MAASEPSRQSGRPLRCRLGLHKERLRQGYWADRTFVLIGVNLYECSRCSWHMKGIGEGPHPGHGPACGVDACIDCWQEGS